MVKLKTKKAKRIAAFLCAAAVVIVDVYKRQVIAWPQCGYAIIGKNILEWYR